MAEWDPRKYAKNKCMSKAMRIALGLTYTLEKNNALHAVLKDLPEELFDVSKEDVIQLWEEFKFSERKFRAQKRLERIRKLQHLKSEIKKLTSQYETLLNGESNEPETKRELLSWSSRYHPPAFIESNSGEFRTDV